MDNPNHNSSSQPFGTRAGAGRDRSQYRLEFDDQSEAFLVNFYEPELVDDQCFRWSEPLAMVRFDVPTNDYEVTIETGALRGEDCNFQFRIYWNDQLIGKSCLLYTSPSPRDLSTTRMPSSA